MSAMKKKDVQSMVRLMLTEKVTHTFDGGGHTMSIEVKDFSQLGGMSVV